METLEVISNKKRQWAKRVQWLRNVHDTPKNNLSSTAADTFGTPISNSVSKWTRSLRIFDFGAGDNPSQLFELCPLFQLTRVTFDPALPYYSIQVTTHAQKDVPSNNTYNIDSYPISSYRLNFHVRTVARFLSGLKRLIQYLRRSSVQFKCLLSHICGSRNFPVEIR